MRSVPASKFIADFGPKKDPASPPADSEGPQAPEKLQLAQAHDKTSGQHRMAMAHARGLTEGKAAAQAEYDAKLQEQRLFYEKQTSIERCTWVSREADKLTEQLSAGLHEMETRIAETVAELLQPFLVDAVRRLAINELMRAIETVLAKDEGITLEIRGPHDLLQILREKLSGKNIAVLFVPAEDPEVRVTAGQTVLETQLGAWSAQIEESLR